jgi:PadR family transcriptional regulator PadR
MHGRERRREGRTQFLRTTRLLEPTLALLLHHNPSHGYTLLEKLHAFGLGSLDNGSVYRALRDMESNGCVVSTWDVEDTQGPPRRVYSLTPMGDQMLRLWIQDLLRAREHIDFFLTAYQRHMAEAKGAYHDR